MLPQSTGRTPSPRTKRYKFMMTPGSISVTVGDQDAGLLGVNAQNRADGAVELCVHQHDRLAVSDGLQRDVRTEFHGPGHLDHDVDVRRTAKQQRIVGDRIPAAMNGTLELQQRLNSLHIIGTRLPISPLG